MRKQQDTKRSRKPSSSATSDQSSELSANKSETSKWKIDVEASVDMYNDWFMKFAPLAFREERKKTTVAVKQMLEDTGNLRRLTPQILSKSPEILPSLRMSTCPPIAVDRLVGLARTSKSLVNSLESGVLPPRMRDNLLEDELEKICSTLRKLLDDDMLPWLAKAKDQPTEEQLLRSASVIADRLCGAQTNPIIRNAQEKRQLEAISKWLTDRGYKQIDPHPADQHPNTMPRGTFAQRMNVRARKDESLIVPVDVCVQPICLRSNKMPIFVEAKSAGDFTNVNKRRKEESEKLTQLRARFGDSVQYVLFLCGYFDAGYLGYEAAEGIDWVWEHRINDFEKLGLDK